MAITFRHDAAAVMPPSNQATRKYGQNLVLQQQQQKYQGQQAGYDRLFDAYKQEGQNQFQMQRDANRNQFQVGQQKAMFDQQQQVAEADRQRQFMDDARKQSSSIIMGDIEGGLYDPATARKLQQNLIDEAEALGNPNLDATQRAEVLAKIRAARSTLTASRQEKPPAPTRDDELRGFLGGNYDKYKDQPWVPDGKGGFTIADIPQPPEQQPQQPTSFREYQQQEPDKARAALDAKIKEIENGILDEAITLGEGETVESRAFGELERPFSAMQKRFGVIATDPVTGQQMRRGDSMPMPPAQQPQQPGLSDMATAAGSIAAGMYPSIGNAINSLLPRQVAAGGQLEPSQSQQAYDKIMGPRLGLSGTAAMPDPGQPPSPDLIDRGMALAPGHPDYKPPAKPTGRFDDKGYAIMDDGSKVDPRDSEQMRGTGVQSVVRMTNPDGSPIERKNRSDYIEEAQSPQQVMVGGKPLAVTPGTLTPQETEARQQIMAMSPEERISKLMPYDQELKGKTIEQILEDPESKAQYDALTKQGLTTGNYREDMLAQMDDMLQRNVLNAAGQSPPSAYVGMNVNDITDPKAKAEVAKYPRPKTADDMKTIRGKYFVDPNGVIRGTRKG